MCFFNNIYMLISVFRLVWATLRVLGTRLVSNWTLKVLEFLMHFSQVFQWFLSVRLVHSIPVFIYLFSTSFSKLWSFNCLHLFILLVTFWYKLSSFGENGVIEKAVLRKKRAKFYKGCILRRCVFKPPWKMGTSNIILREKSMKWWTKSC